jgi:hypothetical protein
MPDLSKLIGWLKQATDSIGDLLRRYGPARGTGLALLFVDLVLHTSYALPSLVKGEVANLSALTVIGGVFALVAFALLSYDGAQLQAPAAAPSAAGPTDEQRRKLEELGRQVFGRLSLLERGEEDRRRVAEVVAVADFLAASRADCYDFAAFFRDLDEFMGLFARGSKEALAGNALVFRDKLRRRLSPGATFQPPFLAGYVQGLVGISYLAERQDRNAGAHALKYIRDALRILGKSAGLVGSLLNAQAICYALLSRDGATAEERVKYTLKAVGAFAQAEQADPGTAPARYRFHVNYVEWSVQTYGL